MEVESKLIEFKYNKSIWKNECSGWMAVSINNNCALLNRDIFSSFYQTLVNNGIKFKGLEKTFNTNIDDVKKEQNNDFSFFIFIILLFAFAMSEIIYLIFYVVYKNPKQEFNAIEIKKEIKKIGGLFRSSRNLIFNISNKETKN